MQFFPDGNPFGMLTLIVAPAILTNASSISTLATSNRLARSIDRARVLSAEIQGREDDPDPGIQLRVRLLAHAEHRTLMLVRALTAFYTSIGSFAAASLVSLLGALFFAAHQEVLRHVTQIISLIAGFIGVGGLMFGSGLLVLETRASLRALTEETSYMLSKHRRGKIRSLL